MVKIIHDKESLKNYRRLRNGVVLVMLLLPFIGLIILDFYAMYPKIVSVAAAVCYMALAYGWYYCDAPVQNHEKTGLGALFFVVPFLALPFYFYISRGVIRGTLCLLTAAMVCLLIEFTWMSGIVYLYNA